MKFQNENLNVAYNTLRERIGGGYGHTKVSCDLAESYTLYSGLKKETVTERIYLITNKFELVEAAISPEHYFNEAEWDNYETEREAKILLLTDIFSQWDIVDDFKEELEELEKIRWENLYMV